MKMSTKKVFLMTKIDGRTRQATTRQIDESLKLLARTMKSAQTGNYEKFKTATMFDGTALHPEWLG